MRRGPISNKAVISAQEKRNAVVARPAGFWQVASTISLLLIVGFLGWKKLGSAGGDLNASREGVDDPAEFLNGSEFPLTISVSPEPIRPAPPTPQPMLESEYAASVDPGLTETSANVHEVAPSVQTETSGPSRSARGPSPPSSEPNPLQDPTSAEPEANTDSSIDNLAAEASAIIPQQFLLAQNSVTQQSNSPASTADNQSGDEGATVFEATGAGLWLEKAPLNDVFQHLARMGDLQYFHNSSLDGEEFLVTGELIGEDSLSQIEELGLMYGLTIHKKGHTVYAFDQSQASRVPQKISHYQLQYLRPDDIEQTKLILQPFLTPGMGMVEFEGKTNSLIISDSEEKLEHILEFLGQIDRPKDQVAIETRIIRISTSARNLVGVDWSSVLGADGGIGITASSHYQLQYLRPDDIEQTKLILQPFLTPGMGMVEFEGKTNSLIISDSEEKLEHILEFLGQIDRPKDQVAIETRIIRISTSARNLVGVDWSSVLGADGGIGITASSGLNALFGLPELDSATSVVTSATNGNGVDLVQVTRNFSSAGGQGENREGGNLVLSPIQISAVIRALNTAGIAEQESSPTLITEDNEEGLISVVDRIPIITSTVSETTAGQNSSEEVRYKIDEEDPSGDPATTREVGVTLAVTPTILPDGTIRMSLRPRSAQVVEYVESPSGNRYPRVNESSVTTMARIPDGHSLLIGGFYEQIGTEGGSKVPVFGDIPGLRHLFKNSDHQKAHTSLVFIVTARLYRPSETEQSDAVASDIYEAHILPDNYAFPDPMHPDRGVPPSLNSNLPRAIPISSDNILRPEYSNEFPGPANRTRKIPLLDRLFRNKK